MVRFQKDGFSMMDDKLDENKIRGIIMYAAMAYADGIIAAAKGQPDMSDAMAKLEESVAKFTTLLDSRIQEADGCPCLLVEPCSYACSCAKPIMSGGCMRCAKYGSMEQRLNAAKRLAALTPEREG